jgi:hypothetical protein
MRDDACCFVVAILLGVILGAVGADYFAPTPKMPEQQIARANRKWCPPNPSTIQPEAIANATERTPWPVPHSS